MITSKDMAKMSEVYSVNVAAPSSKDNPREQKMNQNLLTIHKIYFFQTPE